MAYAFTFYLVVAVTLLSAGVVVFSRRIVYSAFSLLFTLMGVAVTYVLLSDDFMAVVQLLLYVGGILVLILFAVMLTNRVEDPGGSNLARARLPILAAVAAGFGAMALAAVGTVWPSAQAPDTFEPATSRIGNSLLGAYLLPFEMVSVLLLLGLVGAVVVARKECRTEGDEE